jgi:hypothetical protein
MKVEPMKENQGHEMVRASSDRSESQSSKAKANEDRQRQAERLKASKIAWLQKWNPVMPLH